VTFFSLVPGKQHEGPAFFNFLIKSFTALTLSALTLVQAVDAWNKQRSVQVRSSLIYGMCTDSLLIV